MTNLHVHDVKPIARHRRIAVTDRMRNPTDIHVGRRIRMRRMLCGLSQEKLGDRLGLTFQQVQKYEQGRNRVGAGRLFDIAHILGVTPAYFYEGLAGLTDTGAPHSDLATTFFQEPGAESLARSFLSVRDARVRHSFVALAHQMAQAQDLIDRPDPTPARVAALQA